MSIYVQYLLENYPSNKSSRDPNSRLGILILIHYIKLRRTCGPVHARFHYIYQERIQMVSQKHTICKLDLWNQPFKYWTSPVRGSGCTLPLVVFLTFFDAYKNCKCLYVKSFFASFYYFLLWFNAVPHSKIFTCQMILHFQKKDISSQLV